VYDTVPHVTHLVGLLHSNSTAGNPTTTELLHSVDDIAAIAELESQEDAIIIAQDEIDYLDNLSLEGDIPDDVSDIEGAREEALFTES
jgi:hypothetical protein